MKIECEVSLGELVDKISILHIKKKNILDLEKQAHIQKELSALEGKLKSLELAGIQEFLTELISINSVLWKIEDDIRDKERDKQFDNVFIDLARKVYITNDQRFECKNKINQKYASTFVEVKSYQKY